MKYTIYYQENSQIKKLKSNSLETVPSNTIKIKRNIFYIENKKRVKQSYLKSFAYELSLMLEANILLDEAFEILIKKERNSTNKKFLIALKECFCNSKDIFQSLEKFVINPLVKSFFKITQDSGDPIKNIKALSTLLSLNEETKKEFLKVLSYPLLLLISFFLCLIGIFKFVVPNFQSIFEQTKIELSLATKALFLAKEFYENYFLFILLLFMALFSFVIFIYKENEFLKRKLDKLLFRSFFIFSSLYKLKIFYQFFLLVQILLHNKYTFYESLNKAKILINNQYVLDRISQIENLLKSGKSISFAFESVGLFDELTISLLKIGEKSNSMEEVVLEIKKIYKQKFDDKLKLFSLLIEPLFLIVIMLLIIWLVLAIFVPLWSMSDMLRV